MTELIPSATYRPTNPHMESHMLKTHKVLDHGMVRLVDYLGDDSAVVQAARVSYGRGTKTALEDAGLIDYLMRRWHTTPFEMCEIKLHVKLPIFIARQWIRHRTACLSGDTVVDFDLPGGIERRGNQKYTMTMEEIFEKFRPSENLSRPERQKNPYHKRDRVRSMKLRSCDEDSISPMHTNVVDIWQSGVKEILRVEFPNSVLRATKDHMCFTETGWMKLGEALGRGVRFASYGRSEGYVSSSVDPDTSREAWTVYSPNPNYEISTEGRVRSSRGIKIPTITESGYQVVSLSENGMSKTRFVHHLVLDAFGADSRKGRDTRHLNNNRQDNRLDNLDWGTAKQNAQDRMNGGSSQRQCIVWIDPVDWHVDGEEMTYDMEVSGPYHNFVAGGVVVHNSVNEYSARYSVLDKEYYIPAIEDLAAQSTVNKQGRGKVLEGDDARRILEILRSDAEQTYSHYEEMLSGDEKSGLSRELARMNLTLNTYTQWYWKTDLHNLLHFLRLRKDPHAQKEIREYADVIGHMVEGWVPNTWEAFTRHQLEGASLSRDALRAVRRRLSGEEVYLANSGMSRREWNEVAESTGFWEVVETEK